MTTRFFEDLTTANDVTHMVMIISGRALLQEVRPNCWSVPSVRRFSRSTAGWAPEIQHFGRELLGGAQLYAHGDLKMPGVPMCMFTTITRVEPFSPKDHAVALEAIERPEPLHGGRFRLFDKQQLVQLDMEEHAWIEVGCLEKCQRVKLLDAVSDALAESKNDASVPALRSPWRRYGWITDVFAWVESKLPPHLASSFSMRPVSNSPFSCVLVVQAHESDRLLWLKAAPIPLDVRPADTDEPVTDYQSAIKLKVSNEVSVTDFLSHTHSDIVPHVLACDAGKGFLLVSDAGTSVNWLDGEERRRLIQDGLESYGRFQRATTNLDVNELKSHGFRDRRPGTIVLDFEEALATRKEEEGFSRFAEAEMMNRLHMCCEALVQGPLPCGIVHGDLHFGNLFVDYETEGIRMIDWLNAGISHPLVEEIYEADSSLEGFRRYGKGLGLDNVLARHLARLARPIALLSKAVLLCGQIESIEESSLQDNFIAEAEELVHSAADHLENLHETSESESD